MLLLDHNAQTGLTQHIAYDALEDKTVVRTSQNVEGILERNKRLQNEEAYKKEGIKRNFQQVADIPLVVYQQWLKEGIDVLNPDHWPKVKAKLQDPENQFLRTTLGRI
jgi:hypothetical protein